MCVAVCSMLTSSQPCGRVHHLVLVSLGVFGVRLIVACCPSLSVLSLSLSHTHTLTAHTTVGQKCRLSSLGRQQSPPRFSAVAGCAVADARLPPPSGQPLQHRFGLVGLRVSPFRYIHTLPVRVET